MRGWSPRAAVRKPKRKQLAGYHGSFSAFYRSKVQISCCGAGHRLSFSNQRWHTQEGRKQRFGLTQALSWQVGKSAGHWPPGRPTELPEIYAKSGCSAYAESVSSYWFDTNRGIMA